jgi:hypothetical protein
MSEDHPDKNSTTLARRVFYWSGALALWGVLCVVTWALSYSVSGDRYDEQAAFFVKGVAGLTALAATWRALHV